MGNNNENYLSSRVNIILFNNYNLCSDILKDTNKNYYDEVTIRNIMKLSGIINYEYELNNIEKNTLWEQVLARLNIKIDKIIFKKIKMDLKADHNGHIKIYKLLPYPIGNGGIYICDNKIRLWGILLPNINQHEKITMPMIYGPSQLIPDIPQQLLIELYEIKYKHKACEKKLKKSKEYHKIYDIFINFTS